MNLKDVFELMDKFDKSSLAEIKVTIADSSVSLKKPSTQPVFAAGSFAPQGMFAPGPQGQSSPQGEAAAPEKKDGIEIITSPIVGTFYRSPAPDSPAFAEAGKKFAVGDTLGIIEAMKVMNKLDAEFKLEMVNILVENGAMVEYGTPLFEVKRL